MLDRKSGSVINMASIAGVVAVRERLAYTMTKICGGGHDQKRWRWTILTPACASIAFAPVAWKRRSYWRA